MSKGQIRKGETRSIPLHDPIWFVAFEIEKNKPKVSVFHATQSGLTELKDYDFKENAKLYGVWNGEWNTHLFDMNISLLKKRIEKKLKGEKK